MTNVVLTTLGIWGGDPDKVLTAYVDRHLYDWQYTTTVVARHALQSVHFRMVNDHFDTGFIYLLCPSPKDANRLNNTTWRWMGERVLFRRVLRLTQISYELPLLSEVIKERLM